MSLLGIDIGTTGCKSVAFSLQGEQLARSYRDYEIVRNEEGYAEFASNQIWNKVLESIQDVAIQTSHDPIMALSVSSLGEAMVPVSKNRKILGNSILGSDQRGSEFIDMLLERYHPSEIFRITGNLPGTFYSFSKIFWIKKYQPYLYFKTNYFLTWADFICFMLGGKPATNYSLAGRTLLFDIHNCTWSEDLLKTLELDKTKFAPTVPSGSLLGYVRDDIAKQLHLGKNVAIVSGGHDQCCATLGSGVKSGSKAAMYAMGTFICVVPVFSQMPDIDSMFANKLHIEHHVVPGSFISFIYNQSGGGLIKWFRQTFIPSDQKDAYQYMFNEITENLNNIIVLPRFGVAGPPDFLGGNQGCITGLSLSHSRGDILRATLEGISFYVKDCFEKLKGPFADIDLLYATGGGSVSDKWLQITADILGKTIIKNKITEASSLGAAIIAGEGCNVFSSFDEAIDSMVQKDMTIYPALSKNEFYAKKYEQYKVISER